MSADPPIPVPPLLYGGIERVVADLVGTLRDRGHEVALLAHPGSRTDTTRFAWREVDPRGAKAHAANLVALDSAVRAFKPDVIHSFSRLAYLGRHLLSDRAKLMCYQRTPTARTVTLAAALARNLSFSGCSDFIRRQGAAFGGRWLAIPNCVDTARYPFVEHVREDAPLVFLSRIEAIKGVHRAIEIASAAGRRLVIAGNCAADGEHARYFEEQIAPRLGAGVEYVGPVDDAQKATLLGGAAALLLPLQWDEPFGIVMIEALACGTPVIVFRRGAALEVVREGIDGFVVDDVEEAVLGVGQLANLDRSSCRAGAVARFGVETVAALYEQAYAGLVTR